MVCRRKKQHPIGAALDPTTFVADECAFQRSTTAGLAVENDKNDRDKPCCPQDVCNLTATGEQGRVALRNALDSDDDFDPTFTKAPPKMRHYDGKDQSVPPPTTEKDNMVQETGVSNDNSAHVGNLDAPGISQHILLAARGYDEPGIDVHTGAKFHVQTGKQQHPALVLKHAERCKSMHPPLQATQVPTAADVSGATTLQPDAGTTQDTPTARAVSHADSGILGMAVYPCLDQKLSNPPETDEPPGSHGMPDTIMKRGSDGATGVDQKHDDAARDIPKSQIGTELRWQPKPCTDVFESSGGHFAAPSSIEGSTDDLRHHGCHEQANTRSAAAKTIVDDGSPGAQQHAPRQQNYSDGNGIKPVAGSCAIVTRSICPQTRAQASGLMDNSYPCQKSCSAREKKSKAQRELDRLSVFSWDKRKADHPVGMFMQNVSVYAA